MLKDVRKLQQFSSSNACLLFQNLEGVLSKFFFLCNIWMKTMSVLLLIKAVCLDKKKI